MTDRELLEIAAKAAGVELWPGCIYHAGKGILCASGRAWWNPLSDDGDALRMAVKLRLIVNVELDEVSACNWYGISVFELIDGDPCAATRRAIVRAAAEIGGKR